MKLIDLKTAKGTIEYYSEHSWKDWADENGFDYRAVRLVLCEAVPAKYGKRGKIKKAIFEYYKEIVATFSTVD